LYNFPDAPTNGQVVSTPGGTYTYDGLKWIPGRSTVTEAPTDGQIYGRQGSTTSWVPTVPVAGGTMTGPLTISPAANHPQLLLNAATGFGSQLIGQRAGSLRWLIDMPEGTTESGTATGSDFGIYRYDNTGAQIARPFAINRACGAVSVGGSPNPTDAAAGSLFLGQGLYSSPPANYVNLAYNAYVNTAANWVRLTANATATFQVGSTFYWYTAPSAAISVAPAWVQLATLNTSAFSTIGSVNLVSGNTITASGGVVYFSNDGGSYLAGPPNTTSPYINLKPSCYIRTDGTTMNYYSNGGQHVFNATINGNITGSATYAYHPYFYTTGWATMNWNDPGGNPSYVVGGNDGTNFNVYPPSRFSVNYATYADNTTQGSFNIQGGGWVIVFNNGAYYMGRRNDGHWMFVENNTAIIDVVSGTFNTNGQIWAGSDVVARTSTYPAYNSHPPWRLYSDGAWDWNNHTSDQWRDGMNGQTGDWAWIRYDGAWLLHLDGSGNLNAAGTMTWSDVRLKQDIEPYTRGLDVLMLLQPSSFTYNGKGGTIPHGRRHVGIHAQDLDGLIPEAVVRRTAPAPTHITMVEDQLAVDAQPILMACVNAIRELNMRLIVLENR